MRLRLRIADVEQVSAPRATAPHTLAPEMAALEQQVLARTSERDRVWELSRDLLGVVDARQAAIGIPRAGFLANVHLDDLTALHATM